MPRVSVVIPVHNGARYISETIDSVLAQTFADWELLVVDDGSTDETRRVLARYGPAVRCLAQPNRGPGAARNAGLRVASGKYIVFLDADDRWRPDFLERAVATLDGLDDPFIGVCTGWVAIDAAGALLPHTQTSRSGPLRLDDFVFGNRVLLQVVLLQRKVVLDVGGFDEDIRGMEDWDLWIRLTAARGQLLALDQCLAEYRMHDASLSHHVDHMRHGRLRTLEKLFARADLPPPLAALRPAALAWALVLSAAQMFAAGRSDEALADVCHAAALHPAVLADRSTHYALICATQPRAYHGTPHHVDLPTGERRIREAIAACLAAVREVDPSCGRHAYGTAYAVLGRLAYGQLRMQTARRYCRAALHADARLWADRELLATFLKSLAGAPLVRTARQWRAAYRRARSRRE